MEIRRRLPGTLAGFVLFVALGAFDDAHVWRQPWFFIGLGMFLSAVFVEPFFSRPQDAIVNAAGGIGIFVGVQRSPIQALWIGYLSCMIAILLAGVGASVMRDTAGLPKWAAFRIASRFGRAAVVGTAALLLIVLGKAAAKDTGFEYLAAATAVLVAGVTVDWASVLSRVRERAESASAVAALGPRMLLAAAARSTGFHAGDPITVEARGKTVHGSIVARLPHRDGLRYQIALASDWTEIYATLPEELILRAKEGVTTVVGAVSDGSTNLSIEFEPFQAVEVGTPVCLHVDERILLYQVAQLRLVNSTWAGASAVVAHASAHAIGWPEPDGTIRGGSHLPDPHDLVHRAGELQQGLPDGFYEIGRIKGTEIPVGLRVDDERRGHIAILGMSGMGKTGVAQRICQKLGENNVVVALDTTGEYASRLNFPAFVNDLSAIGHSVHEPEGDPPTQAATFIRTCMEAGVAEYRQDGVDIQPRVVLLEEAHSFVPEWNFALRNQQDQVAFSTRMIMQSRKFGITFIIVSQRTAVVSKSALSQCENYIILKTIDQTSLDYLESVVGHQMRSAIPSLRRFEAICVGPAFNAEEPVIVTLSAP
jgi:hypothetical protein